MLSNGHPHIEHVLVLFLLKVILSGITWPMFFAFYLLRKEKDGWNKFMHKKGYSPLP